MSIADIALPILEWQRDFLRAHHLDPDAAERLISLEKAPRIVGDPTLGGDGLRVAVDAVCPRCGWPERFMDTTTRRFGCIHCPYTSDERNA